MVVIIQRGCSIHCMDNNVRDTASASTVCAKGSNKNSTNKVKKSIRIRGTGIPEYLFFSVIPFYFTTNKTIYKNFIFSLSAPRHGRLRLLLCPQSPFFRWWWLSPKYNLLQYQL